MKIVMQQTIQTQGEYFLANRQYDYIRTEVTAVNILLPRLKMNGKQSLHYVVEVNGKEYKIPSCTAVEYDKCIPEAMQNRAQYIEDERRDHTKDWQTEVKNVFGIEINNNSGADIDLTSYNSIKNESI